MSSTGAVLASAVVIPDAEPTEEPPSSHPQISLKRRQSEVSDHQSDTKRAKLCPVPASERETAKNDSPSREASATSQKLVEADATAGATQNVEIRTNRRKSGRDEERKRGQRMFGALLGALSSTGGTSAKTAKRRADIEKRQADKLKQLEADVSQKEKEQAEDVTKARRKDQWDVDAAAMRVRHANMLAHSRFISTETEPKLYYKPWDLRQEEEAQIDRQISEAEDQIEREVEEFERKKAVFESDDADALELPTGNGTHRDSVGSASREQSPKPVPSNETQGDTNPENATNESLPNSITEADSKRTKEDANLDDEHHGETVLEAEEDTVIY